MIGMLLWQVFADSIQCPLKAVTAAKPMLSKVHFPPEAILMAGMGDVLFSFLIRLVLVVGTFVWYNFTPPLTMLLVPIAIGALAMLGFTIGVLVTPLGVLYNDVSQALSVIITFWLLLTPVVYPAQESGWVGFLSRWNPVGPLVTVGRDWLTVGTTTFLPEFGLVSLLSLVMLFGAWVSYRMAMPHLIVRMGN
jgi:lipopolysaccharide transport system permease protein